MRVLALLLIALARPRRLLGRGRRVGLDLGRDDRRRGSGDRPAARPAPHAAAIRVRAGDEWVGASALLGDVMSPTAVRVSAVNDLESVVVILPPEPAAVAQPDGALATFS